MAGPYWSNADGKGEGGTPTGPFDSNADVTSRVANTGPFYSNADVPTGISWAPVVDGDFLNAGFPAPDTDPGSLYNSLTSHGGGEYSIDFTGDGGNRAGFSLGATWWLGMPPGWQDDGSTHLIQRMTIISNSTNNNEWVTFGMMDWGGDYSQFFATAMGQGFCSIAAPTWCPATTTKPSTGYTPAVVLTPADEPQMVGEFVQFGAAGGPTTPPGPMAARISNNNSVYYRRVPDTYGGRYVGVASASSGTNITAPIYGVFGVGFRLNPAPLVNCVIRVKLEWCARPTIPVGTF